MRIRAVFLWMTMARLSFSGSCHPDSPSLQRAGTIRQVSQKSWSKKAWVFFSCLKADVAMPGSRRLAPWEMEEVSKWVLHGQHSSHGRAPAVMFTRAQRALSITP